MQDLRPSLSLEFATEDRFSDQNRRILARYWYAVAYSADLKDRPLGVTLLDIPIVLYRSEGTVSAALDRCPHRGARLSKGEIEAGNLVCPYHGLQFNGAGRCARIPASPKAKIPEDYGLSMATCTVAYNLIWVCLSGEPQFPLPEWRVLEGPAFQNYALHPIDVPVSASRFCENFNDVTHFSWVHRGTFGGNGAVPDLPYSLEENDVGLVHRTIYRQIDRTDFDGEGSKTTDAHYSYDFTLPFSNHMQIDFDDERTQHILAAVSPVSNTSSRVFMQFARNYDRDKPIEESLQFEESVVREDLAILEDIHPATSTLETPEALNIAGDKWSIAYRKRLLEIGLRDGP